MIHITTFSMTKNASSFRIAAFKVFLFLWKLTLFLKVLFILSSLKWRKARAIPHLSSRFVFSLAFVFFIINHSFIL